MTTLADKAILTGADNRPPVLEKRYENVVTRPKKYSELSATKAIQADCDVKATNIILQGLPPEVYALVSNHKVTKELWKRIQLLMQDDPVSLSNSSALIPNSQFQPQVSPYQSSQYGSPYQSEQYSHNQSSTPLLITYPSNDFQSSVNHDVYSPSSSIPQVEYAPLVNQQHEFSQPDSSLIVPVFQKVDDLNTYDSDRDELHTAKVALMANLSHYGSDALVEVHNHDNVNNNMINQAMQVMPSSEQSNIMNHSETEIMSDSDSNIIPYSWYVIESQHAAVQNSNFPTQQDALILSIQVRILKEGQNVDLKNKDNVSDSCAQSIKINHLKQTLSKNLKEKESLMQTITLLKNDFKKEESRNINRKIALEQRIKHLDNIVFKREPTPSSRPTKVEVPKELLKVRMVNTSLKKLKHHLASFKVVVKERTTTTAITKGVNLSTSANGSQPSGSTKKDKIQQTPSSTQKNKIEAYPRTVRSSLINKNYVVKFKDTTYLLDSKLNVNSDLKCVTCNGCLFSDNHDSCVLDFINNVNARVRSKSVKKTLKRKVWKPTGNVFTNIRYIWRPTGRTFTIVRNTCPLTRIITTAEVPLRKPIALESDTPKPVQNGVVERRNRTLIEAARTMLIYAKASLFLWAEEVATACYTQKRFIVRLRHEKTPYELLHDKLHDLSFFHVFGALCYPTNDSEDLGKLQPKADIGIFIGYAPTKKAFQIYNRRTRLIIETIHVDFDELIAMAFEQSSSGPVLHEMTLATISSGIVYEQTATTSEQSSSGPALYEMTPATISSGLVSNPTSSTPVDHPAPKVIVLIAEVVAPESAAPTEVPSDQSSSTDVIHTIVHPDHQISEHNSKWTMKKELNEFERLGVWELVPRPDKVIVITLKWIYKVKLDELGGILKNKARLVARGYCQEEGIDFEESFAPVARIVYTNFSRVCCSYEHGRLPNGCEDCVSEWGMYPNTSFRFISFIDLPSD
uniref:Retrovirus-related Pol polyprotein from transposon TNT 1-94 n=1 Tax=Tanacetum cinerariifolium TaxID=118510 RepID=A0A699GXU4_TANCI|nr:retrovirus-related Pol polyprotein from transposon TNT 1-94 [Tanacetum cinerariifolium]